MNRHEKKELVEHLKSQFSGAPSSVIVQYKGLTVAQLQKLRRGLTSTGGSFKIAKARLLKRAADDNTQVHDLIPFCKGQVGIVFVPKDAQAQAVLKFLHDFSKDNEALTLIAGSLESKLVDKAMMTTLAMLPSREVLLAMVCGTLKAPLVKLAYVLKQVQEKKQ